MQSLNDFYKGKRVLVTGHTGFKGTWLVKILLNMGAIVIGYSLNPPTKPNLFDISQIISDQNMIHIVGDIRDLEKLKKVFDQYKPEIVFHLAAQPIVRDSYKDPIHTYSTNVMGTVHVLECVRTTKDENGNFVVKSVLNVTTDKVYKNREWCWGYRENEMLDGYDPYSNSKSCSELVTHSYRDSFFKLHDDKTKSDYYTVAISTARAGNVIGGGDFANDRIIPDCVRAIEEAVNNNLKEAIIAVRNPYSIRPYQHVLEPLFAYLEIAARQYADFNLADCYNVGPDECDCVSTGELVDLFCSTWNCNTIGSITAKWISQSDCSAPHEANFLKLDTSKIKNVLEWNPAWRISDAIEQTIKFVLEMLSKKNISAEMSREIDLYIGKKSETGEK